MTELDLENLHSDRIDSSTSLAGVYTLLFGFAGFLLAAHNSFIATTTVVVVLGVQIITGGIIWILLSRQKIDSTFEVIGMGCVIGFLLATISDQVLRFNFLGTVSWLLPSVLVCLAFFVPWVRTHVREHSLSTFSIEDALFILCVGLIGQGLDNNAATIAALILGFALILTLVLRKKLRRPSIAVRLIPLAGIMSAMGVYWLISEYPKLTSQFLRPLFLGTIGADDQIFSEQMSWSISKWGLSSNSAAAVLPIKYHWLSLGWSGMMSKAAHVGPFVVTLHVVPIVAFIVIACLAVALAQRLTSTKWLYYLAPLLILATDNSGHSLRFVELNTSNLLTHIWFIGFILAFHKHLQKKLRFPQIVLPALAAATTLGKGPYGVVLCVGIVFAAVALLFTKSSTKRSTITALFNSGLASVIVYLALIRSPSIPSGYRFSWAEFVDLFPSPLPNTTSEGTRGVVLGLIVLFGFILMRFAGIWKLATSRSNQTAFNALVIGASIAGFISFLVKGFQAEKYFINAGLVAGSIATLAALAAYESESRKVSIQEIIKLICLTLIFFVTVRIFLAIGVPRVDTLKTLEFQLQLVLACFSAVLAVSTLFIYNRYFASRSSSRPQGTNFGFKAIVSLVAVSVMAFSTHLAFGFHDSRSEEATVPKEELEALAWIRTNVPQDAILATNRSLCPKSLTCDDVETSSHLVSAFSRRRVLIEGLRFVLPTQYWDGREYPAFIQEPVSASLDFIQMPTEDRFLTLSKLGVTWLYVVLDPDLPHSWDPWGTIVFSNSTVAVVKLRNGT